jgi:transcriptional/translational regulatory protein YebC/TACO1
MMKKLEALSVEPESASLHRIPKNSITLDEDSTRKALRLIEILEEDEDTQNVFHNLEITDEMADKLS